MTLANAIADAFGLGIAKGELESVSGGRSHLMWRLHTDRGTWAVKKMNRSHEPWWLAEYLVSVDVEEKAVKAGVAMPQPIEPLRPIAPYLAEIEDDDENASFRVHNWCAGKRIEPPGISTATLKWVGETLAALHRQSAGSAADNEGAFKLHGLDDWERWLREDPGEFGSAIGNYLSTVDKATQVVAEALPVAKESFSGVLTHRDFKPDNVLVLPDDPVLVDWDAAGFDWAEWELVRTALDFSRAENEWDAKCFQTVIRSYESAGGRVPPSNFAVFAGVVAGQLQSAAYFIWRGLGHRPVTARERAESRTHAVETLQDLQRSLFWLGRWASWLGSREQ